MQHGQDMIEFLTEVTELLVVFALLTFTVSALSFVAEELADQALERYLAGLVSLLENRNLVLQ